MKIASWKRKKKGLKSYLKIKFLYSRGIKTCRGPKLEQIHKRSVSFSHFFPRYCKIEIRRAVLLEVFERVGYVDPFLPFFPIEYNRALMILNSGKNLSETIRENEEQQGFASFSARREGSGGNNRPWGVWPNGRNVTSNVTWLVARKFASRSRRSDCGAT